MSTPTSPLDPVAYEWILKSLQARSQDLVERAGESHVQRPQAYAADKFDGYPPPFPDARDDPERVYFTMIDNPNAPCILSIDELEPMTLSELVMGSHHRGKLLLVKFETDRGCARLSASACVRDGQSDVECLAPNLVCMNLDVGHHWPPQGQWFAIKEPHLTLHEMGYDPYIRVDHPSDILEVACLPPTQLTRPVFSDIRAILHHEPPLQCKEAGKSALANGDVQGSMNLFSKGLQYFLGNLESESSEVKRNLLRNRAYARLKLGQYEGAVTDAIASLSNQTLDKHKDAKSYFRAGQASYALGDYDAAATFSKKLLDLLGDHPDAAQLLSKTEARLREQTSGVYDIAAIKNVISGKKPRVNAANFLSNTTVKPSTHSSGHGLFATRNLEPGDLILAETAFASAWDREKTHVMAMKWDARFPKLFSEQEIGLWKVVLQQVRNNPVAGRSLLELPGDHNVLGSNVVEVDGMQVVDAYQVHDIVARNTLRLGGITGSKRRGSGIYIRSSYVNHSGDHNAERVIIGDLVLIHATKAISDGEEICLGDGKEVIPPLEEADRSSPDGTRAVTPSPDEA
jgi:tetratricopeptide (TPR) repeat protein